MCLMPTACLRSQNAHADQVFRAERPCHAFANTPLRPSSPNGQVTRPTPLVALPRRQEVRLAKGIQCTWDMALAYILLAECQEALIGWNTLRFEYTKHLE